MHARLLGAAAVALNFLFWIVLIVVSPKAAAVLSAAFGAFWMSAIVYPATEEKGMALFCANTRDQYAPPGLKDRLETFGLLCITLLMLIMHPFLKVAWRVYDRFMPTDD